MARVYQRDAVIALLGHGDDPLADRQDLSIRDDGIYVLSPSAWAKVPLMPAEIDELVQHPERDPDRPALPFPFTLDDFLRFEESCGVFRERFQLDTSGEFNSDALAEVERRSAPAGELLRALFDLAGLVRARPPAASRRYALVILEAIARLNKEPLCLPRRPRGPNLGIKTDIWNETREFAPWLTEAMFKSGWELLRKKEEIAEEGEQAARCKGDRPIEDATIPSPKAPRGL